MKRCGAYKRKYRTCKVQFSIDLLFSKILSSCFAQFSRIQKASYVLVYGLQWTKYNLQQKIHCVFVDVSERLALLSRHKIDVKENISL